MAYMPIDYTMEAHRICSFKNKNWKLDGELSIREIAEAGLYYTGRSDIVKCAWCPVELSNWKANENPIAKHSRNNPRCQFVIQVHLSNQSKFVDEINSQMLELGLKEDLDSQIHVKKSNAVKIVEEMGYNFDIILKAVDKISSNGYGDMNVSQLLDEVFKLEEQERENEVDETSVKDVDLARERSKISTHDVLQKSKTLLKPGMKNEIVKEAIIGVLSFEKSVTVPRVLNTIAIITYCQLVLLPVQHDFEEELRNLVKENHSLKKDLGKFERKFCCKVCLENQVKYIFFPCCHLVCCEDCYIKVNRCPVCRSDILDRQETFMG